MAQHWGTPTTVRVRGSGRGEGSFIRQNGPPGHYGHVILIVEASPNDGLTFMWEVAETAIPKVYAEAVQRGIQRTCEAHGAFAGSAFTRTTVRIVDGSFHDFDSRERSFELAAAEAFENAVRQSGGTYLAD